MLRRIEARFGRLRGKPNAPRTLDLDLIAHGRAVLDDEALILPHPRAADRLFVINFGQQLADGKPHDVMNDPEVKRVYMGMEV